MQVIVSAERPCDLAKLNIKLSREEARNRYDQIAEILSTGPPELQLTRDFDIKDLNVHKIKRVFRLLDLYFYNRTLFQSIKRKNIKIFWEFFPFNDDTFQPCLKMVAIHKNGTQLDELHFQVNKNRFHDSAKYRFTNGVKTRNKLEALCVSGLHEIVHAILYVFCPEEQGHNETFLSLNHKLHGSDSAIYEYRDEVPTQAS